MVYINDKKCKKKKSVCCQEFNLGSCMPEWSLTHECARTLWDLIISKHIMGKFPPDKFPPDIWRLLSVGIKAHAVEFVLGHNRYKIRHIKSQMISPIMSWFSILSVCSKVQWTQGVGSILFFGIRWETMTLHSFSTGRNSLLHHVHAELTNTAKPLENTRWIDATPSFSLEP